MRIYIAGHTGLVGSALVRRFSSLKTATLILIPHAQLDLTHQTAVENFLKEAKPDIVLLAAGRVGGIQANSRSPASFIYDNLLMEANVIHAAYQAGVKRLLNFGASCLYPKSCPQPMTPDLLMTGKIEPTNEPYAIAKLAGMSLCDSYNRQYHTSYLNVIPSNLYGPGDNFDLDRCHVVSALIRRFHDAKIASASEITLWGSGQTQRDFLYVDDLAAACELLLEKYHASGPINIGAEAPCSIRNLAVAIATMMGYSGKILWDTSRPDGAPIRFLKSDEIQGMGWSAKVDLKTGLKKTYDWFLKEKPCAF